MTKTFCSKCRHDRPTFATLCAARFARYTQRAKEGYNPTTLLSSLDHESIHYYLNIA